MSKRALFAIFAVLVLVIATAAPEVKSQVAQTTPMSPPGFTPIAQARVNRRGCEHCPVVTQIPPNRYPMFGLGTDSVNPISFTGRIDVNCVDGSNYNLYMRSPTQGGLFQLVPNLCVNFDAFSVKVDVQSASLSPPDVERTFTLTVYGRIP
jgi:hypothetical protein